MQMKEQRAAIRRWLNLLEQQRKPRGRRTIEFIVRRLAELDNLIATEPDPLKRVQYLQQKLDLQNAQQGIVSEQELAEAEEAATKALLAYSEHKGISRAAWREVGVPARVLNQAGVK